MGPPARAHNRTLKVSRTIAVIEGEGNRGQRGRFRSHPILRT